MAFRQTKEYRQLKQSLMDNLAARGLVEPIYQDMVRRYLSFREMEYDAEQNIRENGLNIWDDRRNSWQQNPCVTAQINASRQAAAIYRSLGFEEAAKRADSGGADDDAL